LRIVETVVSINDQRKRAMGRRIIAACGGSVRGKTIAILGLAFKPNTDDMREAPSLAIVTALLDAGAKVRGYDPESMEQAKPLLPGMEFAANAYDCVTGAHAVALLTEWDEFRALDLRRIKDLLAGPILVDLRNIYHPDDVRRYGLSYTSVGR
jgi:Predicted UDP-glucose 6-dehydrogenase